MSVSVARPALADPPVTDNTAAAAAAAAALAAPPTPLLTLSANAKHGDFRDALFRDGVVVVPGVVSEDRAAQYVDRAHAWLESFGIGYKREDERTWDLANLPYNMKGGLYTTHGVCHSQLAWDIRQEPAVVEAFARVWGTDELLVSFDGLNIGVPLDLKADAHKGLDKPWPHTDQSPTRPYLHCVQGIVNLAPNGPLDGGLTVLRGSKERFQECFEMFDHLKPEGGWSQADWFAHAPEMLDWLEAKGCWWEKICAGPGDLILWDSRTVHYGAIPSAKNPRVAAYVCYKPASLATPDTYAAKQRAFEALAGATHDPLWFRTRPMKPPVEGDRAWAAIEGGLPRAPVLSDVGRKLAGLEKYGEARS